MTRKDYTILANIIKATLGPIQDSGVYYQFIDMLCNELTIQNNRFNNERFRKACSIRIDYEG